MSDFLMKTYNHENRLDEAYKMTLERNFWNWNYFEKSKVYHKNAHTC